MSSLPTLHVMAPFHTIPRDDFSHCAFTGKALRFSQMMKPFGYKLVEYANAGSTSAADVKIVMLNEEEFKRAYKPETSSPGAQANVGTPAGQAFNMRASEKLREHAKPGDIVCHIWTAQAHLVNEFPGLTHIETGIGYPQDSIGRAYRIFESEAWRNYHWGRVGSPGGVLPQRFDMNPARTWIVPNYFDSADWPLVKEPVGDNVVFMSRFIIDKGIEMLRKVIKLWQKTHPESQTRFVLAGMGGFSEWFANSDFSPEEAARIDYRGVVTGKARAALVGNARAFLLPSIFVEPFGGAGVEAMLTGTPLLAPELGAFTETIEQGVTGFRCRTVEDYVEAIANAGKLSREKVSKRAVERFSLGACGALYDKIFRTVSELVAAE